VELTEALKHKRVRCDTVETETYGKVTAVSVSAPEGGLIFEGWFKGKTKVGLHHTYEKGNDRVRVQCYTVDGELRYEV